MAGIRGLAVLVGLAVTAAECRAQLVVVPNPYLGASGSGFFYGRSGRHSAFALAVGSYNPYLGVPYGYSAINQVTIVYPPIYTPLLQPAPVLSSVSPAPRVLRLDDLAMLDPELRPDQAINRNQPPDPQLPGGREAGVFRPLAPDNRDRANRPVPPEPARKPEPAPLPRPQVDLPRPTPPDADPKVEGDQQMKRGREAHAAKEYGRAIERFRDAAKRAPGDAMPLFLLAQSLFAAGRYDEAVDAVQAGVRLRPDWPTVRFPPRELYGPNAADFADHLRRLRDALDVLPDDPVLLFLYGYELWLDGRHEEARPLFRKARPGAADPTVIDRFLVVRPVL
jgi:hypothetical protein